MEKPAVEISEDSRLEFRELVYTTDKGVELVGCPPVQRFLEVDRETVVAIEALRVHGSIRAADAALRAAHGEDYDLMALTLVLLDRGFVGSVDGKPVAEEMVKRPPRLLTRLKPQWFRFLRNPWFLVPLAALNLAFLAAAVAWEPLRPTRDDMYLFASPGLSMGTTFLGLLVFAFLHELAHFFTAWSYGVLSSLSISHRFYLIVLQTNVTNAWLLPVRARLAIFLAGLTFNLTAMSLMTIPLALYYLGVVRLSFATLVILQWMIYLNIFPIMFQMFVFARTDLYYVLMSLLGQRNLSADARLYVRFLATRLWRYYVKRDRSMCPRCSHVGARDDPFCYGCRRPLPVEDPNKYPFSYRSQWALGLFAVIFGLGVAVAMTFFGTFLLVFLPRLADLSLDYLARGYSERRPRLVLEGAAVLTILVIQLSFFGRSIYQILARGAGALRSRLRRAPEAAVP